MRRPVATAIATTTIATTTIATTTIATTTVAERVDDLRTFDVFPAQIRMIEPGGAAAATPQRCQTGRHGRVLGVHRGG